MAKSVIYKIFSDLVSAMSSVVNSKYIFLKDRPNINSDEVPMSRFLVIDLPGEISDYVIGGQRTMLTTTGVIYAFVQARANNTLDVNAMGDFTDSIISTFPISGISCVATNPSVRLRGSDNQGFQMAVIPFDLRCRWGAFND